MTLEQTVQQLLGSWSPDSMRTMATVMSPDEVLKLSSLLAWAERPDLAEALIGAAWTDEATTA